MEISPSLFELEEGTSVSIQRVEELANEIIRRYDNVVEKLKEQDKNQVLIENQLVVRDDD